MSRPGPSRAVRIARRAAERVNRPGLVMAIPDSVQALTAPQRPPCPIDPDCHIDHLNRKKRQ